MNAARMTSRIEPAAGSAHERWYRYGVAVLLIEMAIAVAVSAYSLYMAFHGLGGFPGK